ncbi:MAG: O-antigen ligase family protein [Ignavibacteriae bacterium]|nr:O-antigen ligase family protein [Ignavibacteriota bacterium]
MMNVFYPPIRSPFGSTGLNTLSPLTVLLIVGQMLLFFALTYFDIIVYFPFLCIGVLVFYVCVKNIYVWMPVSILGHVVLFMQKTEEITASELAFGVLFYGILLYWLFEKVFIKKERLATSSGDSWLIFFFVIGLLSIVPAVLYSNSLSLWFREYLVFLGLLFYFPAREVMQTERGKKVILGTVITLALFSAARNIWQYRTRLSVAEYAWEVLGGRQAMNEPLFMVMILVGAALWMVYTQPRARLVALICVSLFSVALIMTFSRGYWLGAAFGIVALLWLANNTERKRLMGVMLLVVVTLLLVLMIGFSDVFTALFTTIASRLSSVATAVQDISFANRLVESEKVIELISLNPLIGYGLGASYTYRSILHGFSVNGEYIHNAYLFLWFKLGVLGLLTFMVAYGGKIIQGVRNIRGSIEDQDRPWVLAATATLICMLQVSITSPQFYTREPVLLIALSWATIAAFSPATNGKAAGAVKN